MCPCCTFSDSQRSRDSGWFGLEGTLQLIPFHSLLQAPKSNLSLGTSRGSHIFSGYPVPAHPSREQFLPNIPHNPALLPLKATAPCAVTIPLWKVPLQPYHKLSLGTAKGKTQEFGKMQIPLLKICLISKCSESEREQLHLQQVLITKQALRWFKLVILYNSWY